MTLSLVRNVLPQVSLRRLYQTSPQLPHFIQGWKSPSLNTIQHVPRFNARWFASYPPHEVVGMPSLSPTMESGTISAWNVGEGSAFNAGDVLCSVETDKATVDFEAQDDGIVAKIIVGAGSGEIPCGTPIMVTVDDQESVAAFKDFVPDAAISQTVPPAPALESMESTPSAPVSAPVSLVSPSLSERIVASPRAHTLVKEKGYGEISALRIKGTGPGGRIIAQDILEYDPSHVPALAPTSPSQPIVSTTTISSEIKVQPVSSPLPQPIPGAGFTDYALPTSALELASRLTSSKKNVPHYYLTIDITLDSLLELRSNLNSSMKDGTITVNDLLLKAAAAAMKTVPAANASWMDTFVRVYNSVDVNVVVGNGSSLYSPVIRDVGRRGLKAISDDFATAAAAVEGNNDTTSVAGFGDVGTFTMVNLGMFGVKSCAPIIREPQACALALGVIENRIVPNDDTDSEEIYKESIMVTATLSCDHRVVDGAVGAQWLSAFKSVVENPVTLLL